MDIAIKLAVLDQIYSIYDEFIAPYDTACKKYCSFCCTRNVTATTLEGYNIAQYLNSAEEMSFRYNRIENQAHKKRFQPLFTTNGFVELCEQGAELPEEENDYRWGQCPLLQNEHCPIYAVRPFGCRCMISRYNCGENGYADMDPFVLTVNNVFLQYIEHVDADGYTGNLTDMLIFMKSRENRQNYAKRSQLILTEGLIPNQPLKRLMIPPEHITRIRPILDSLQNIKIP